MKKTLSYIGLILILILGLTSCVKKEDENYANQTKANTVITEINQLPTTDAIELTESSKCKITIKCFIKRSKGSCN